MVVGDPVTAPDRRLNKPDGPGAAPTSPGITPRPGNRMQRAAGFFAVAGGRRGAGRARGGTQPPGHPQRAVS
jgi:hypothetical protein